MLNKTPMVLRISTGTKAKLLRTMQGWQAELAMASDTGQLFICTATESPFQPVQTLNLAVCHDNQGVVMADEMVYSMV